MNTTTVVRPRHACKRTYGTAPTSGRSSCDSVDCHQCATDSAGVSQHTAACSLSRAHRGPDLDPPGQSIAGPSPSNPCGIVRAYAACRSRLDLERSATCALASEIFLRARFETGILPRGVDFYHAPRRCTSIYRSNKSQPEGRNTDGQLLEEAFP